jgi:hypothetical protein
MAQPRELAARFEAYGDWRNRLARGVSAMHAWLREQDLADAQVDLRIRQLLERLREDKLVVAFAAEFSRGKSELINAIFFADFGARLLPATAGRTTMCPTELLFDAAQPPSIRLLPIETRLKDATVRELRSHADEWATFPLDLADAGQLGAALARVSEVKEVPIALARALGLDDDASGSARETGGGDARVSVPCWRHAILNFPHPLLRQGLVIIDTPGLNAIGAEPELTLNVLSSAHVVLFVLAADTGVTRSDLDIWKRDLAGAVPAPAAARIAVLNKIDSLWDDLKPEAAIAADIDRQVLATAAVLELSPAQVFPVSAHKALLAKVNGDDALLERSRLPALEDALSRTLLPARRDIVGAATMAEVRGLASGVRARLEAQQGSIAEQLAELRELRGRNQDVVQHMLDRGTMEKELFERGMQRFTALRTVFTQQTNALFDIIGLEALRANAGRTRRGIERSPFTKGVRAAMADFFTTIRRDFGAAADRSAEIHEMMEAMYTRFAAELGSEPFTPPPFSMLKYQKEIDRLERAYNQHFNTLWNMLSKAKFALTRRFFETVASRVKHVYEIANRDVEGWLRSVMSPLETHVREHQLQLQRRLESIERIHAASAELEARIRELDQQHEAFALQIAELMHAAEAIDAVARQPAALPMAANA